MEIEVDVRGGLKVGGRSRRVLGGERPLSGYMVLKAVECRDTEGEEKTAQQDRDKSQFDFSLSSLEAEDIASDSPSTPC